VGKGGELRGVKNNEKFSCLGPLEKKRDNNGWGKTEIEISFVSGPAKKKERLFKILKTVTSGRERRSRRETRPIKKRYKTLGEEGGEVKGAKKVGCLAGRGPRGGGNRNIKSGWRFQLARGKMQRHNSEQNRLVAEFAKGGCP